LATLSGHFNNNNNNNNKIASQEGSFVPVTLILIEELELEILKMYPHT